MASYYIDALRAIQPRGPYLLGGYSFGGWVAFEMAQQLRQQGEEVSQLFIFDTLAPRLSNVVAENVDETSLVHGIVRLLERLWGLHLGVAFDRLQTLSLQQQLEYTIKRLQALDVLPSGFDKGQLRGLIQVLQVNSKILYTPERIYPCKLTLFRASDQRPEDETNDRLAAASQDPTLGWGSLCGDYVEVHFVPGDHSTMLLEPHVKTLADKLRKLLPCTSGK
jgi:thioesterase domain-containing protein